MGIKETIKKWKGAYYDNNISDMPIYNYVLFNTVEDLTHETIERFYKEHRKGLIGSTQLYNDIDLYVIDIKMKVMEALESEVL